MLNLESVLLVVGILMIAMAILSQLTAQYWCPTRKSMLTLVLCIVGSICITILVFLNVIEYGPRMRVVPFAIILGGAGGFALEAILTSLTRKLRGAS